jgi:NADPH-dependent 2,4-dienoyl-CoA reductase/sulfur reductase-like enzyme
VLQYGALLLATGAEPRKLSIEGADLPHVHLLRTLADSKSIIAAAKRAKRCVVIGSSFIGLEAAASLRQRGLEVTIVGRDHVPLEKVLGPELGRWVQGLHEQKGVRFVLGASPRTIRKDRVELDDGQAIKAELVVVGVGVTPRTALAEECGLDVDDGIVVDESLRASVPDIYAAGDIARYPDTISGERVRIEHWVLAERHGQAVARAILGLGDSFRDAPFFWSQHYDSVISYVGHASSWDDLELHGDLASGDACAIYRKKGRVLALATVGRDRLSLETEAALEQNDQAVLKRLFESL